MANASHSSYFSSFSNDGRMFSLTPASSVIDLCRGNSFSVLFCSQGGLRNSKHEFTLSSQEYVHELRSGITEEKLFHCLESLRVSLTSNPVRLVLPASFTLHNCPVHAGNPRLVHRAELKSPSERAVQTSHNTPSKVCCKETAALGNYQYTHGWKINKWYFPLICNTLQKKKKETCQTRTQLRWRITLLCLIVHNAAEMIKAQTKR